MDDLRKSDLERVSLKIGEKDIISKLVNQLSGSELNTLLLKVFSERVEAYSPSDLLNRYQENRFVHPGEVEVIELKQLELDILNIAKNNNITPIQLSPVAPLGSASIVGEVNQNNVISSLRGTEVVSDATNLLALHICDLIQSKIYLRGEILRFCTTHRHTRAQFFGDAPGMLPHFHLFCNVTSGIDKGSYSFERESFWEHVILYQNVFKTIFNSDIEIIISERGGYKDCSGLITKVMDHGEHTKISISVGEPHKENQYYKGFQFTIKTVIDGVVYFIGDGGFVDWTQKILGNKKERFLISAIGLDRILI